MVLRFIRGINKRDRPDNLDGQLLQNTHQSIPREPGTPRTPALPGPPTFSTLVPRETSSPHLVAPPSVRTSGRQRPDLGGPNEAPKPRQTRDAGTWFNHHLIRVCTSALASEQMLLAT
jgi:hypothetical protein